MAKRFESLPGVFLHPESLVESEAVVVYENTP